MESTRSAAGSAPTLAGSASGARRSPATAGSAAGAGRSAPAPVSSAARSASLASRTLITDSRPRRHRREEHDDDAQAGEEADLLYRPGQRAAHRCPRGHGAAVPGGREHVADREPGAAERGQPAAEQRHRPVGAGQQDEAADDGGGARQDLQPEPARCVGPAAIGGVGVVEGRADEGDQRAPGAEQYQQHAAQGTSAPGNPQHRVHVDHFLCRRQGGGSAPSHYPEGRPSCKAPAAARNEAWRTGPELPVIAGAPVIKLPESMRPDQP